VNPGKLKPSMASKAKLKEIREAIAKKDFQLAKLVLYLQLKSFDDL
jgi:transposase